MSKELCRFYKNESGPHSYWMDTKGEYHSPDEDTPSIVYHRCEKDLGRPIGTRVWYIHGDLHRMEGFAVEHLDGTGEYWINSSHYTEEEFVARGGQPQTAQGKELSLDL